MKTEAHGRNFEEMAKVFGYGKAVVMFQEVLPEEFWSNVTIKQQVFVYESSLIEADNELAEKIFYRLANMSIDFAGWQEIHDSAPLVSDLQALAKAKMVELAVTFEHWQAVYNLGPPDGDLKKIAREKVGQLSANLRQAIEEVD